METTGRSHVSTCTKCGRQGLCFEVISKDPGTNEDIIDDLCARCLNPSETVRGFDELFK